MQAKYNEITFTDADLINVDDFIPAGSYNPHRVRPLLIHDAGFVVAVVFADSMQGALDAACDAGKLEPWLIDPRDQSDREDYMVKGVPPEGVEPAIPEYIHPDGSKWWWKKGYEPTCLGNVSEPHDIEGLEIVELPNPKFSFVALFNAYMQEALRAKQT